MTIKRYDLMGSETCLCIDECEDGDYVQVDELRERLKFMLMERWTIELQDLLEELEEK